MLAAEFPVLPELVDVVDATPDPSRLRRSSSSAPETLDLGFFRGLPTYSPFNKSGLRPEGSAGPEVDRYGGVVERLFDAGGVDPDAGVSELVAGSPIGSAECCRLSYVDIVC